MKVVITFVDVSTCVNYQIELGCRCASAAAQRGALMAAASRVADGAVLVFKDVGLLPPWRAWGSRLNDLVIARQWIHIVVPAVVEAWMVTAASSAYIAKRSTCSSTGTSSWSFARVRVPQGSIEAGW
jgi:hypothetical protein